MGFVCETDITRPEIYCVNVPLSRVYMHFSSSAYKFHVTETMNAAQRNAVSNLIVRIYFLWRNNIYANKTQTKIMHPQYAVVECFSGTILGQQIHISLEFL